MRLFFYLSIFLLLLLPLPFIPGPEEIRLLLIGYFAAVGSVNYYLAILISFLALFINDNILFWLSLAGSKYAKRLEERVKQSGLKRYKDLMRKNVGKAIFILTIIPGLKVLGPILAGSLKIKKSTFWLYDSIAVLFYALIYIFIGYRFHNRLSMIITKLELVQHLIFLLVLIVFGLLMVVSIKKYFLKTISDNKKYKSMPVVTGSNIYPKLGQKVDKDFFRSLEKEGIIFDSGKIWLTFRAKNLKGKGIYASSLICLSRGQLLITKSRFIAIVGGYKIIDILKNHPWFEKLIIDRDDPKRYKITLDLNVFHSGFEGIISLAYHINPVLVDEKIKA